MIFLYAVGIWFIFLVAAILNGAFRNSKLVPIIGQYAGHVVSTIILVSVILLITFVFLKIINIEYTNTDLLLIGTFWVVLTMIFEFVFGHYVMKTPWQVLITDYNIFKGRVWLLVLVAEFIAPILFGSRLSK